MADRESTSVGYRLRIAPPDLGYFPDSVKQMWFGWVLEYGLKAKDRELDKLRPLGWACFWSLVFWGKPSSHLIGAGGRKEYQSFLANGYRRRSIFSVGAGTSDPGKSA